MWWLIWVVTILAVIGIKVYTTRTVIRTRFKVADLLKQVARARQDEKVARNNLEMAKRLLLEIRNTISKQMESNEKLKETIAALEQAKEKKAQEMKKKLTF